MKYILIEQWLNDKHHSSSQAEDGGGNEESDATAEELAKGVAKEGTKEASTLVC